MLRQDKELSAFGPTPEILWEAEVKLNVLVDLAMKGQVLFQKHHPHLIHAQSNDQAVASRNLQS